MSKPFLFGIFLFFGLIVFANENFISAQMKKAKMPAASQNNVAEKQTAVETNAGFLSAFEKEVIDEINLARTNPQLYASYLEEYKKFYNGRVLSLPSQTPIVTNEGTVPVDEVIKELKELRPLGSVMASELISKATKDHLQDLVAYSFFSHNGSDGKTPQDRLNRYIITDSVPFGENIVMAKRSARELVFVMLIDDGAPGRGHRKNLLNASFKFVGLSNGINKNDKAVSVVILAADAVERKGGAKKQTGVVEL